MSTMNQENRYIAELARISSTSVSITFKIVEIQLAMLLRDLGTSGESQTFLGNVKIDKDGNLIIAIPNKQIKNMLDNKYLLERLTREFQS